MHQKWGHKPWIFNCLIRPCNNEEMTGHVMLSESPEGWFGSAQNLDMVACTIWSKIRGFPHILTHILRDAPEMGPQTMKLRLSNGILHLCRNARPGHAEWIPRRAVWEVSKPRHGCMYNMVQNRGFPTYLNPFPSRCASNGSTNHDSSIVSLDTY